VYVAFDYSLTFQVSVENPCEVPGYSQSEICAVVETSHTLIIEQIPGVLNVPAPMRHWARDNNQRREKRNEQVVYIESGFTGEQIYGPIETIVAMDAHPNGSIYELTSNSSIYDMASNRVVCKLLGCEISSSVRWSASFDPITAAFHIYNSDGKHYIVQDISTGICHMSRPIQRGIVGVSHVLAPLHPHNPSVRIFALQNNSNSFGMLHPHNGEFTQISVLNQSLGDGFVYNFDATYDAYGTLQVLLEDNWFYKLDPRTGNVSVVGNYPTGRLFQSFTFPAANFTRPED